MTDIIKNKCYIGIRGVYTTQAESRAVRTQVEHAPSIKHLWLRHKNVSGSWCRNPVLVVMGDDSCFRGCGFKSQGRTYTGWT